jgi:hypothetical protein
MYKTCIYCNRSLGTNREVEHFPIGRRLAFDGSQGRLWVICAVCRRWNLSPLDERWEAIEDCERLFYNTPRSFSTDNIGLAQLSEGLELVRVGKPRRREFAAWRYGREFMRRRIRRMITTGSAVVASVAAAALGADIGWFFVFGGKNRVVGRVRDDNGKRMAVVKKDLKKVEMLKSEEAEGWSLLLPYRPRVKSGLFSTVGKGKREVATLDGPAAIRAAGIILPKLNAWGGTNAQVKQAVQMVEESREPERLFASAAGNPRSYYKGHSKWETIYRVDKMDANVRLALEMAAHEESERRALEGELAILEAAWREAEEIASIADRLLIPDRVENLLNKFRLEIRGGRSPEEALAELEDNGTATI